MGKSGTDAEDKGQIFFSLFVSFCVLSFQAHSSQVLGIDNCDNDTGCVVNLEEQSDLGGMWPLYLVHTLSPVLSSCKSKYRSHYLQHCRSCSLLSDSVYFLCSKTCITGVKLSYFNSLYGFIYSTIS